MNGLLIFHPKDIVIRGITNEQIERVSELPLLDGTNLSRTKSTSIQQMCE